MTQAKFNQGVQSVQHILLLASLIQARPLRLFALGAGSVEFVTMCLLYGFDAHIGAHGGRAHAVTLFNATDSGGALSEMLLPGGILVLDGSVAPPGGFDPLADLGGEVPEGAALELLSEARRLIEPSQRYFRLR